jgi:hypothetical protein
MAYMYKVLLTLTPQPGSWCTMTGFVLPISIDISQTRWQ